MTRWPFLPPMSSLRPAPGCSGAVEVRQDAHGGLVHVRAQFVPALLVGQVRRDPVADQGSLGGGFLVQFGQRRVQGLVLAGAAEIVLKSPADVVGGLGQREAFLRGHEFLEEVLRRLVGGLGRKERMLFQECRHRLAEVLHVGRRIGPAAEGGPCLPEAGDSHGQAVLFRLGRPDVPHQARRRPRLGRVPQQADGRVQPGQRAKNRGGIAVVNALDVAFGVPLAHAALHALGQVVGRHPGDVGQGQARQRTGRLADFGGCVRGADLLEQPVGQVLRPVDPRALAGHFQFPQVARGQERFVGDLLEESRAGQVQAHPPIAVDDREGQFLAVDVEAVAAQSDDVLGRPRRAPGGP